MVSTLKNCPMLFRTNVIASKKCEKITRVCHLKKHLSSMVPVDKQDGFLKEKFNNLLQWYDEFTGMDEVREAQKRVVEDEKNFRRAQDERRKVVKELREIQSKIKDLYSELDTTNRGEDRYVQLVTEEHKLLKQEKVISDKFAAAEKDERDFFAALSSSVKLSHEKERAQSERTKYWSIIGSVMGTVLGILGTSINNHFKMNQLHELIKNSADQQLLQNLHNYLESNEKLLEIIKENEQSIHRKHTLLNEDFFQKLNIRITNVEQSIKNIEHCSKNTAFSLDENGKANMENLVETVKKENSQTKLLLFSLVVLSILMPIITKYS